MATKKKTTGKTKVRVQQWTAVSGSNREVAAGAKEGAACDPSEIAEVTIRVRQRVSDAAITQRVEQLATQPLTKRRYLTREQFSDLHGADPADLAKIDAFAHDHHLTVVESSIPKRLVRLKGTIGDLSAAFGVKLHHYRSKWGSYRGRTGQLYVPQELSKIIVGVFGLDNRPVAKPHWRGGAKGPRPKRTSAAKKPGKPGAGSKNAPDGSFVVTDILSLYNFPANLDGSGETIALIELNTPTDTPDPKHPNGGAGYKISDLNTFFSRLKLKTPSVAAVSVDGGANLPGINPDADGEVTLDIEVAGAAAPGASIAVYFAPNTDQGFIDAVNAAIHDTVRKPSIISISWGGPEDEITEQFRDGLNSALSDAAALGVTVCAASGDSGSSDLQRSDGKPHADFPSSAPFSLGCGGTKLIGQKTSISSETVWNEGRTAGAGGGGVSTVFPLPAYQQNTSVPKGPNKKAGRGVPDVAGVADPETGYQVVLGGKTEVIGGTSAVAPLWAGLIARLNQQLAKQGAEPAGFLNPLLYQLSSTAGAFRDIVDGTNDIDGDLGVYSASPGWDACTGLGSPNAAVLIQALVGDPPPKSGSGGGKKKKKKHKSHKKHS